MNEDAIQRGVFEHIRRRAAPGVFAFHPKNGGIHQHHEAQRRANAARGVVSGVPDVIAIKHGHVFALELKTADGIVEPEQFDAMRDMALCGVTVGVAHSLDAAIHWLENMGLLVGHAQIARGENEKASA